MHIYECDYESEEDYVAEGIIPIEPMTAKEIMEKDIDMVFSSEEQYIVEEKFDGVRANVQFVEYTGIPCCRVFSRRKSVVTGFYKEKTDNLPQLRNIHIPELTGTILDGEMLIPHLDFKATSAVLNCLPAEAVERQQSVGKVCFYAFDCLYFKGKNIMNLPLKERKKYLNEVIDILYEHGFETCIRVVISYPAKTAGLAYYHRVVARGGEGIMIKNLDAPYEMKRTRGYQKLKKKLTRDVVILGFAEPTKEYTGKFPNDKWDYWFDEENEEVIKPVNISASELIEKGYTPVTRNWYEGNVGAIKYGVKLPEEWQKQLSESWIKNGFFRKEDIFAKTLNFYRPFVNVKGRELEWYVEVGECEGMTDDEREEFTRNEKTYLGKVIEVECNEVFKDTGKLRHPRFLRLRKDKNAEDCTWEAHINE